MTAPKSRLDKLTENLRAALCKTWSGQTRDFLICLLDASVASDTLTKEGVDNIESLASDFLGSGLESAARKPVIQMSSAAMLYGKQLVSIDYSLTTADQKAIEAMQKYSFYWVGKTYDRFVSDEIGQAIGEYFRRGLTRAQLAEGLEIIFKDREKPKVEGYFSMLADHLTMKLSEMGHVSGYEEAGIEYVEIVARLDERTSQICRALHGRIIPISVMSRQRDEIVRAAASGDMEAVKRAQPMIGGKLESRLASVGKTSDLISAGIGMPPYHFRCRTTTVAHFEPATYPEKVAQWATDGEVPTKQASKLITYAKNAHWGTHDTIWRKNEGGDGKPHPTVFTHYMSHREQVGASSLADYNEKAIAMLRGGSREMYVAIDKKEHPYPNIYAYDVKTGEFVIFNIKGQTIASYYKIDADKWESKIAGTDVHIKLPKGIQKWIKFMNI